MKTVIREFLIFAAVLATAPWWLPARLLRALTGGESAFAAGSEWLSLVPGRLGVYLRRGYYRMTLDTCASDCHIGFGTTFAHPQARIGHGVYIGNRCTLGTVEMGDHATIGSNVDILSGRRQHNFLRLDVPIQHQGGTFERVRLGRNCWIGNSSVVMADVGDDCVIGAGSVVVKPVPARSIAVGNPATVKRNRESEAAPTSEHRLASNVEAQLVEW
jgi:acetyltransferase-like isoleucine patch superfamily enzyme